MRPSRLSIVLVLYVSLFALSRTSHAKNHEPPRFPKSIIQASTLNRADQYIVLDFLSQGCFQGCLNRIHYRLRYEPTPSPQIKVWEEMPCWKIHRRAKGRRASIEFQYLATITLNRSQVLLFDDMLDCYRKPARRTSRTERTIILKQYEGGKPIIAEQYKNANSRVSLREDASPQDLAILGISDGPVLSLLQVRNLASKAYLAKRQTIPYVPTARAATYASLKARSEERLRRDFQKGEQIIKRMPDYNVLQNSFIVKRARANGEYVSTGEELSSTIVPRRPGPVDSASWTISDQ